jgi:hypothetical protein
MPLLIGALLLLLLFFFWLVIASFIIILLEFYMANYFIISLEHLWVKKFTNYILSPEKICIYTSINKIK